MEKSETFHEIIDSKNPEISRYLALSLISDLFMAHQNRYCLFLCLFTISIVTYVSFFWLLVEIFLLSASTARGRTAAGCGSVQTERNQELDRALIQQLRERCEHQELQLQSLQAQLKKASLCMDVFSITTQHFCLKVGSSRALRQ